MKKITSCGGYTHVRKSNFELLRLICIFGIVSMHIFGSFYNSAMGINLLYGVFINSMFNTCVSVFVLISGYFGIKFSGRKYLQLELEVLFYSILSTIIVCVVNDDWTIKDIIKAFLPVSSSKYWYITGYMLLMLFSGFINKVPEKLEKRDFQKLLLLMFIIFSAVPTIIWFHVMNDNGKGIANMLLMYFIGRYIRLYWDDKKDRKYLLWSIVLVLMGFVLNLFLTMLRGGARSICTVCKGLLCNYSVSQYSNFYELQADAIPV